MQAVRVWFPKILRALSQAKAFERLRRVVDFFFFFHCACSKCRACARMHVCIRLQSKDFSLFVSAALHFGGEMQTHQGESSNEQYYNSCSGNLIRRQPPAFLTFSYVRSGLETSVADSIGGLEIDASYSSIRWHHRIATRLQSPDFSETRIY